MGYRIALGVESACDEAGAGVVRDGRRFGHGLASRPDAVADTLARKAVAAA
ncbi:hypothetical protein ACFYWX_28935 [Streptomyces sp. NPDC002888]|uniref:hypothetical protein n=1 Tax=Streptomyces sp. NPDC002888 TaxID=3364668 RepID=UPI00369BFE35